MAAQATTAAARCIEFDPGSAARAVHSHAGADWIDRALAGGAFNPRLIHPGIPLSIIHHSHIEPSSAAVVFVQDCYFPGYLASDRYFELVFPDYYRSARNVLLHYYSRPGINAEAQSMYRRRLALNRDDF